MSMLLPCLAQGALTLLTQFSEPVQNPNGHFGFALALSSGTLAISSFGTQTGPNGGEVHVYEGYGTSWTHVAELHDPTPVANDDFGWDIALQGDELFVGAIQDQHSTLGTATGSVHVYRRSGATWNHVQLIEPSNPVEFGDFGSNLAVHGDMLFISGYGAMFVYQRQGSTWVEQPQIPLTSGVIGLAFKPAFDGTRLAIGDTSYAYAGFNGSGAVQVFVRNGAGWTLEQVLGPSNPSANSLLGWSVALRGGRIAAGALYWPNNAHRGAVYVFDRVGSVWQETQCVIPSDTAVPGEFGRSVTLLDDRLYVGADGANTLGLNTCGALYAFDFDGTAWHETQKLTAPNPTYLSGFGWRQTQWLDNLVVSAVSESHTGAPNAGQVYVLDLGSGSPMESYCTSALTSHGCTPSMSATGTPSASANSGFVLRADGVEGQRQGLLFYGVAGRESLPWAATGTPGYLCVRPPTQRVAPQNSGGTLFSCNGSLQVDWNAFRAAHPASLGQPFSAGSVVDAQAWFRDPTPGKTTALSDALEFLVQP
jgi:hypothetical protein